MSSFLNFSQQRFHIAMVTSIRNQVIIYSLGPSCVCVNAPLRAEQFGAGWGWMTFSYVGCCIDLWLPDWKIGKRKGEEI